MARAIANARAPVDLAEKVAEWRGLQFSDEEVEARIAELTKPVLIGVHESNWDTVMVYQRCAFNDGQVAAVEVRTVAEVMGVAFDIDLLDGVRLFGSTIAQALRAKAGAPR